MPKFLSRILKNKKTLFLILLFAVVIVSIPCVSFAGEHWYSAFLWDGAITAYFNSMIMIFMTLPLLASAVICDLVGILLTWAINAAIGGGTSYTNSGAVIIGLPIVRELANMLIVLGFIIIGVATSLRFREYEAKKLLAPLIIVALLVNFSSIICGVFIDGTNILMKFFFGNVGSGAFYATQVTASFETVKEHLGDNWMAFVPTIFSLIFFNITASFIYIIYIFLLIGRIIALWMLVIMAPLAFVCYVFPFTKSIWQMWWKNFFQWCIIGIPAGLFYYIGASMMQKIGPSGTGTIPGVPAGPAGLIGDQLVDASALQTFTSGLSLMLPALFLIVGFLASLQIAPMGASALMSMGKKTAMGMGKMGAGAVPSSVAKVGNAMKDKATAMGEKLNLVPKGTTADNQASRLAEPTKRLENIKDNKKLAQIAEQRPITHNQALDKAAAAQILAKRGALGEVNATKLPGIAAYAQSMGASKEAFTKADAQLGTVATDKEAAAHMQNQLAAGYLKDSKASTMKEAQKMAKGAMPTKGPALDSALNKARQEIKKQKTTENALGLAPLTDKDAYNELANDERKKHVDAGLSEKAIASEMAKFKPSDQSIANTKTTLSEKRIQKAVQKYPAHKVSELPTEAMGAFAKYAGEAQITNLLRNGSEAKIDAFDKSHKENVDNLKIGNDEQKAEAVKRAKIHQKATRRLDPDAEFEDEFANEDQHDKGGGVA